MTTLTLNYKILLDNNCATSVSEEILSNIPYMNTITENIKKDNTILDKTTLYLVDVNPSTFTQIITLVKYNAFNSNNECQIFNETFIKNMDECALTDFILITHRFGLEKFKQIAATRFINVLRNNSIADIRTEFKIKNNLSPEDTQNIAFDNEWR